MKKNYIIIVSVVLLLLGGVLTWWFLRKTCDGPWCEVDEITMTTGYKDMIEGFHETTMGSKQEQKASGISVYVDFSGGAQLAMIDETNKALVADLASVVFLKNPQFWQLGNKAGMEKIVQFKSTSETELYNKITNANGVEYTNLFAPIGDALSRIVNGKNDALLISDFEEYPKENEQQNAAPWAAPHILKWIEDGNSVKFFAVPFVEDGANKKLFFAVFTFGDKNNESLLTKIEEKFNKYNDKIQVFELNPKTFKLSTEYGGNQKHGLVYEGSDLEVGNSSEVLVSYQNGRLSNKSFESFEFDLGFATLYESYFKDKNQFSRKLFLNAKSDAFNIESLEIKAYDVTDNFLKYGRIKEAKKNAPTIEKNEGGDNVWSEESNENEITVESYKENSTELKDEYQLTFDKGKLIPEFMDYDKKMFSDHLRNNPEKVEIITKFHDNFNLSSINPEGPMVIRIDIMIGATSSKTISNLENMFKWGVPPLKQPHCLDTSQKANNTALYNSIIRILDEKSFFSKAGVLHSFYIKILPNEED